MKKLIFYLSIIMTLFFASCDPDPLTPDGLIEYVIEAGDHASSPPVWDHIDLNGQDYYRWEIELWKGWFYSLPDNDNDDWNKLAGISFRPFSSNVDNFMIAARYSTENVLEIAPYFNIGGDQIRYPKDSVPVISVDTFERIIFEAFILEDTVATVIHYNGDQYEHAQPHDGIKNFAREIGFWFGGNQTAPDRITIGKKRIE